MWHERVTEVWAETEVKNDFKDFGLRYCKSGVYHLLNWEAQQEFSLFFKCIFIYLTALGLSCSMWDLVPRPGIKPRPPAWGTQSLSHWTHQGSPRN